MGVFLNFFAVAVGSFIGLRVGNRFSEKTGQAVMTALGLVVVLVAMSNAERTGNVLIPLISLVIGTLIGEWLNIEGALERFGGWLRDRVGARLEDGQNTESDSTRNRFISGFVTASLVFCVGPLTILGSIQDGIGLPVGFQQIAIKSALDFFGAIAFAASLGAGVFFSAFAVLLIQGAFTLAGVLLGNFMSTPMINEMTSVGGLLLLGLALILLDIKRPRVANMLPALLLAPLIVAIAGALGVNVYPL